MNTQNGYKVGGTTVIDSNKNGLFQGLTAGGGSNTVRLFTNTADSRVLKLRDRSNNTGNIIQFEEYSGANTWELVGRKGGTYPFYIYKATGNNSGYKLTIDQNGHGKWYSGDFDVRTGNLRVGSTTNSVNGYQVNGTTVIDASRNITGSSLTVNGSGQYVAGSIYSDSNWGMIFRAKQASPNNAQFRWADSADTELMRIDNSGNLDLESGGYRINGTTVIDSSRNSYFSNVSASAIGNAQAGLLFQPNVNYRCIHPTTLDGSAHNSTISLGWSNNKFKDLYLAGAVKADSGYQVGSTTVIDSSRNGFFANTTHTGNMYWNGHIYWGASKNIYVQSGECSFDVSTSAQWRVWDATNSIDAIKVTGGSQVEIGQAGARGLKVFGSITATGNITAYSDRRLKDNIKTLDGSKVYEMRGVSFTKDGELGSGVIAQELEQVAPELVLTNSDEMQTKSVSYGNVVGYLIEAIKELKLEIEELKNGNNTN